MRGLRWLMGAGLLVGGMTRASAQVQPWVFGTAATTYTTETIYLHPQVSAAGNATEANRIQYMPTAGTLANLRVLLSAAPGAGNSVTLTVRKNSASPANGLTCTISGASATSCQDTTDVVSLTTTDTVEILRTSSGTPTAATIDGTLLFVGTTDQETVLLGASGGTNLATSGTEYLGFGTTGVGSTAGGRTLVMPFAGTLRSFYGKLSVAPGASKSRTFTIQQNGANTAMSLTFSGASQTTQSDTTNTVTVAAGDTLVVSSTTSNTPAAAKGQLGVVLVPTIRGMNLLAYYGTSILNNAATVYAGLVANVLSVQEAPDANCAMVASGLSALYVVLNSAPGQGTSWSFTPRVNAANATSLTLTISGTNTTGNASGAIFPATDDLLDTAVAPSGTPTGDVVSLSYAVFINPGARRTIGGD